MPLDLTSFAIKWQQTALSEKSAYQQHFRDLCEALGVPHPTEEDVVGASYMFEKPLKKVGGETGFADVWKRDAFAWEYKGRGGDLKKAYKQLNEYHEDLGNPPLLIVCDLNRFEIHTKFDSHKTRVYAFDLEELRLNKPVPTSALLPRDVLEFVFKDRNRLRPEAVTEKVTRDAATDLLQLAQQLELERAASPTPYTREQIAHFLIRIVFCLFADSIGLIPNNVFRKLVESSHTSRVNFNRKLPLLFEAMGNKDSFFGADDIPYFNGGLFEELPETIELEIPDCAILRKAAKHDWSQIEPSIFGTLFERSLDAAKRSMIGAHYTSPEDILLLVEPVVMTPLRRQWAATRDAIEQALAAEQDQSSRRNLRANRPAQKLLEEWAAGLQKVRILDPACGSGNFLYIAMKQLLDLWEEARVFGLEHGLRLAVESMPTPAQLYGIETDFYAHEIASAVVWIGLLQWKRDHTYNDQPVPILRKLDNIQHDDAIMRYDETQKSAEHPKGKPYEPEWPEAEYIVGNPPFLGGKLLRRELGDTYVNDLFALYKGLVPQEADLVTYWFFKAASIVQSYSIRAGLIATQAIRAGVNREALKAITRSGGIFLAWSNRKWNVAGAAVRVSMIGFDDGAEAIRTLDGHVVQSINVDLSTGHDVTKATTLIENAWLSFQGPVKVGAFEVPPDAARKMITAAPNPNGRPNTDVVVPWINARDLTQRSDGYYIVDFQRRSEQEAALYELPFDYVTKHVKPSREENKRKRRKELWWQHGEANLGMRKAIAPLKRYIASPRVSTHRFFKFVPTNTLADSRVVVIAREDDYFIGALESRPHQIWSLANSSRHGVGNDITYNIETCFDTFPFPWPPGKEPSEADSPIVRAIADAARELVRLRDNWLNPKDDHGQPIPESELKDRTLTKLYNTRPAWLDNAHKALDEAVFAAYGWPPTLTDQEILAKLLALNHERAAKQDHATGEQKTN